MTANTGRCIRTYLKHFYHVHQLQGAIDWMKLHELLNIFNLNRLIYFGPFEKTSDGEGHSESFCGITSEIGWTIWVDYCLDFPMIKLVLAFEMSYLTSLLRIVAAVQLSLLPGQVSNWVVHFFTFNCTHAYVQFHKTRS